MGDPAAQLALWNKRLARSQEVLDNYRKITRYPHDSRPAEEHGDQMYPNQPVVEEKRLYKPGDELKGNVRLRTSQERIFVAGRESVLFTITAFDGDGALVPVNIIAAGIIDPPQGGKASTRALVRAGFNDGGADGDVAAGDGTLSFRFTPALQGFADYTGQLRLDMTIEVNGQSGYTYFDIYYTPEPPAIWAGSVREVIENGSLNLYLKVQVRVPGRYVATGRLDDFTGKPFALAVFNEELAAGTQEIPFRALRQAGARQSACVFLAPARCRWILAERRQLPRSRADAASAGLGPHDETISDECVLRRRVAERGARSIFARVHEGCGFGEEED